MSIVKKSVVVVALSFLNFLNGTDVYAVAGKKISKYELPSLRFTHSLVTLAGSDNDSNIH